MEILNVAKEPITGELLFLFIIFIFGVLFVYAALTKENVDFIQALSFGTSLIIVSLISLFCLIKFQDTIITATIDETVPFTEIIEKYDIEGQDGKLFYLIEKEKED